MRPDVTLPKVSVLDTSMAYREAGSAAPDRPDVLFLHGNPTSSFIWRNIMSGVAAEARCIAPDLVGFGQSGKPRSAYRFFDHVRYLDAFIAEMGLASAYVVAQDWGTALAFHLAARRPEFVRGMVFMEFIRPFASWSDFHQSDAARETFRKFRTPSEGEAMILEANAFVERVLPGSVKRTLTEDEMAAYRAPFPSRESRIPILRLPNELPIEGEPADVAAALEAALLALRASTYPKALLTGDPGALVSPAFAKAFAAGMKNIEVIELGPGAHYLQEDHPEAIAAAVVDLIRRAEREPGGV